MICRKPSSADSAASAVPRPDDAGRKTRRGPAGRPGRPPPESGSAARLDFGHDQPDRASRPCRARRPAAGRMLGKRRLAARQPNTLTEMRRASSISRRTREKTWAGGAELQPRACVFFRCDADAPRDRHRRVPHGCGLNRSGPTGRAHPHGRDARRPAGTSAPPGRLRDRGGAHPRVLRASREALRARAGIPSPKDGPRAGAGVPHALRPPGRVPQFGFYLGDQKKPDVGWVDLHRRSRLSGEFGAMDQIFPHELLHVMVRQLAGEPRESGGNQVHAIGVRSDPVNAFNEGFAEHAQILAVDDPDAAVETRALATNTAIRARADRAIDAYARDLARAWWPIQPSRMRFLLWYNQTEQAQRYHAVKANLFARAAPMPAALLARQDKYLAYSVPERRAGRAGRSGQAGGRPAVDRRSGVAPVLAPGHGPGLAAALPGGRVL